MDRTCAPLPEPPEGEDGLPAYEVALAAALDAEDAAVHVLWALTGRQFGLCDTTVRPCPAANYFGGIGPLWGSPFIRTLDFGHWSDWPCGCLGSCTVAGPRVVHLPGPAVEVLEVIIGDELLADDDYTLEGDALYRAAGESWPSQNLGAPLGEAGTWSVKYTRGQPVPAGGAKMAGQLAIEFANACADDERCRLPRTLVSTSRKGATNVFDPSLILANGKTGLPEVDLWLSAINPNHLAMAPSVL